MKTNLQNQLELLQSKSNEAEMLSALACDPETRRRNRRLADRLRDEAHALRRQIRALAA
jgi:hypothetical protein